MNYAYTVKTLNMKKFLWGLSLAISMVGFGCKSDKSDAEIQNAVNEKITANAEMKDLNASVNAGVVTLTGHCKDDECRKDCQQKVEGIAGVKQVVNNITVGQPVPDANVEISDDATLKTAVNDVVKGYNKVEADVKDGVVTLRGEIARADLQDLMQKLNELKPKKIDNELVIK
jgi:hyperosmotically inducible periplasmic protein